MQSGCPVQNYHVCSPAQQEVNRRTLTRLNSSLPPQSLGDAIRCLVDLNERLTLDKIRTRNIPTPQGSGPPSPATGRAQVPYDASVVFMLELMMSIAGEAEHAIHETW